MKLKQLALSIALSTLLLCVTLAFPGCSGTGGSINNLADMARFIPPDMEGLLIHIDVKQIKSDDDLDDLYDEFNLSSLAEEIPIDINDIETIGMVFYEQVAFLGGDFDIDVFRDKMIEQDYKEDIYKDVEIWIITDYLTIAIFKNIIVTGAEDVVKACIDTITGEKNSYYDKNEDIRDVINKLPDGILTMVVGEGYYENALAMGISFNKADENTLKMQGIYKFDNENNARNALSDFKKDMESDSDVSNVELTQKQEYIEISTEMAIEDWTWF